MKKIALNYIFKIFTLVVEASFIYIKKYINQSEYFEMLKLYNFKVKFLLCCFN